MQYLQRLAKHRPEAYRVRSAAAGRPCPVANHSCRNPVAGAQQARLCQCVPSTLLAAAVLVSSSFDLWSAPPAAASLRSPQQPVGEVSLLFSKQEQQQQQQQQPADELPPVDQIVSEEVAMPQELQDFLQLYQKGSPNNAARLEAERLKVGFSRSPDGRVSLISASGERFQLKADMRAAGYLLLRDENGFLYYLPADEGVSLAQVDLSDDVVVAQLFCNRLWEDLIEPLEAQMGPKGQVAPLQMSEIEFRGVVSLVEGAQPQPEEPLEGPGDENGDAD